MDWYCIRSQLKREPMAAASLRRLEGVEVFYPRLARKKLVRGRLQRPVESLFPNYLFARFEFAANYRAVRHARGVATILHFGGKYPVVEPQVIEELKAFMGSEVHDIPDDLLPGDEITVLEGPFQGQLARVVRVKSGMRRVQVLLDFLGRRTEVELPAEKVVPSRPHPLAA